MSDPWLEQFEQTRKNRRDADRTLELLGETLVLRPAVPAAIGLRYGELARRWNAYLARLQEAQEAGGELPTDSGIGNEEMYDISLATIRACLTGDSWPVWERLAGEENDDPISLFETFRLADWFLSRVAALPTDAPTASSNGRPGAEPSSTAGSRSRARTRKG